MQLSVRSTLLLAIFLFPVSIFAQSTAGLVAHWPFSGNASDNTGKGHNGTMNNITATTGKSGLTNTAVRFAGAANSYITVPYQPDLNLTTYSFCAVLKPEGFYTNTCQISMIMARGVDHGYTGSYFLSLTENVFDSSCTTHDTNRYVFTCGGGPSNYPYHASWIDSPTVHTNQWYCVIGTFDGAAFKIYINGQLKVVAPPQSAVPIGTSTDGLSIGANIFGNSAQYPYWFQGVMDDLRIYNRVLTANEIAYYCNPIGDGDWPININEIKQDISVEVTPNPNNGVFYVQGSVTSNALVEVYNAVGQVVYRNSLNPVNNTLHQRIELPEVAEGVYIVKVTAGEESKTFRMLIHK